MSDIRRLIDDHLAAYADPDRPRRSAAVQRLWAEDGGGQVVLEGTDFAQLDAQGRLACVTGFFGPLPALEAAT